VQGRSGAEVLDRGALSDHAPVAANLCLTVGETGSGPDV
jgi:hypothetical protein